MENIFILTIRASHQFDNVMHQSAHSSREHAFDYSQTRLAELQAEEEPEYRCGFWLEVEEIAILG